MNINTNFGSLYTRNNIEKVVRELETNYERLSSAKKLNAAKDDAAGIAITENMNAMIRGNKKSIDNMSMVVNMAKVADGGLDSIASMLQRIREIAIQANNGTYSPIDKAFLQQEADNLIDEIDHIAQTAQFNGINVLNAGKLFYDPNTTTAAGGIENGTKIVNIGAGSYVDVPFAVPSKGVGESSILTFKLEKDDLVKDTITYNEGLSTYYDPSDSEVIRIPDGYKIKTLVMKSSATGDIEGAGEYLNVSINGKHLQRLGDQYDGRAGEINLLTVMPELYDAQQFTISTAIPGAVTSANINVRFEVEYELKGSVLTARSPLGEYFGPGTGHLGGTTGPQTDYANASTYGAVYTGGGDRIDEQLKFYDAQSGTWYVRVHNPSSTESTRVKVTADYRITEELPVHTGYEADDRELYTLSIVSRDTLGLRNLDVSTQNGIKTLDGAIDIVSKERQKYGLMASKYETLIDYRSSEVLNVESSRSKITDADMAQEASFAAKNKILYEASVSMLVSVNQTPSEIVKVVQQLA